MSMNRLPLLAGGVFAALLAACSSTPSTGKTSALASLAGRSGSQAQGSAEFTSNGDGVLVALRVTGLTPGQHGIHLHEVGDCSAADASSAKGHFNPGASAHGHYAAEAHHAGDLPNLVADSKGEATYRAEVHGVTLTTGPQGLIGRSIVIHADPDDYRSQPAGNSGPRIACGVIAAR